MLVLKTTYLYKLRWNTIHQRKILFASQIKQIKETNTGLALPTKLIYTLITADVYAVLSKVKIIC